MAHEKLSKSYWEKKDDIIAASVSGWNPLQRIPQLLAEAFADFKNVTFGFFDAPDLPERMSMGWEFVTRSMFDPDSLNEALPARFGLEEVDGRLKWRDNYLMFMDKGYRHKLTNARQQSYEDKYRMSVEGRAYTSPHDPKADEMKKHAVSKLETQQIRPASQEQKRGPGRPPKNK